MPVTDENRTRLPRVFISYSHGDASLVVALTKQLRFRALDVRLDQVDFVTGDSLIQRIGDEIRDGDFVVAIISERSVSSAWCQTELRLAATRGVNENRAVILPVRIGEVTMPSFLADALYAPSTDAAALADAIVKAIDVHLTRLRAEGDLPVTMQNVMMFPDAFLREMGIEDIAPGERKFVFETMMAEIHDRMGPRLIGVMTEEQLEAMDGLMDEDDDGVELGGWLLENVPAAPFIWRAVAAELRDEYRASKEQEEAG